MKSLGHALLHLTLLTVLFACGKDNESGKKSNQYNSSNPLSVNSPYSYGGMSVNQVMQQNPCRSGFAGNPGFANQNYNGQRIPYSVPLTNFQTVVPPNDIYVGVSSYGDVGVIVGQNVGQPPLFVGYMCPRSFAQQGLIGPFDVSIGAYSNCLFKPIVRATVTFPGGGSAGFRMMDYGSSANAKFSFCR